MLLLLFWRKKLKLNSRLLISLTNGAFRGWKTCADRLCIVDTRFCSKNINHIWIFGFLPVGEGVVTIRLRPVRPRPAPPCAGSNTPVCLVPHTSPLGTAHCGYGQQEIRERGVAGCQMNTWICVARGGEWDKERLGGRKKRLCREDRD